MAHKTDEHLFAPSKIAWMLDGGLESLEGAERQLLLVMAETKMQEGYKPTLEERQVVEKLRDLAGNDYDAQDISRKVRKMVKGPKNPDTGPLQLPPAFERLIKRFRQSGSD
jgi:hypothetical protein